MESNPRSQLGLPGVPKLMTGAGRTNFSRREAVVGVRYLGVDLSRS